MLNNLISAINAAPDPALALHSLLCFAGIVLTLFVVVIVSSVVAYRDGARARRREREFTIRRARMRRHWSA